MNKITLVMTGVVMGSISIGLLFPTHVSQAQTTVDTYRPQTIEETIAYLYGIIAQLQAQIDAQNGTTRPSGSIQGVRSGSYTIELDTLSARSIEDDEATLRSNIDLDGARYANAWFEYGETSRLGERTRSLRITNRGDDTRSFERTIDDLDEDERYYYQPVAQGPDGKRVYGTIRSFTTDDDRGRSSRSSSRNDEYELSVSDTRIDAGDEVEVDWEIPSDEISSRNWIGLYEAGDSNSQYISWKYIDNDDSGTEEFTIHKEGDYEFRLFLNNSYNDEVESREIEVD